MEKKEVRVKCNGCGKAFKLKVPVTSEPVRFKCPSCGKHLKIRVAPGPVQPPPAHRVKAAPSTEFESTQLPGTEDHGEGTREQIPRSTPGSVAADRVSEQAQPAPQSDQTARWVYMADDMVQGPFTDDEMRTIIRQGNVGPETPIRMGERPWIKAGKIGIFKPHFPKGMAVGEELEEALEEEAPETSALRTVTRPFHEDVPAAFMYPVQGGHWQPLAIFAGIAVAASIILCLDTTIGLFLNFVIWILLYGYLSSLLRESIESPGHPPPNWRFAQAKDMAMDGIKVLAVLALLCLVPPGVCLLLMIYSFLNQMVTLGYVFMVLVIVLFAVSMLVVPAALSILVVSEHLMAVLSPGEIISTIKTSGRPYFTVAAISLAVGALCLLVTIAGVFLTDIPLAGFVLAGLIMGVVLSYGHFIWFHAVGRFTGEKEGLFVPSASPASA